MHGRPAYRPILIAWLVALACLLAATPSRAQEDATPLDALTIAVWPEYDQQSALVFYTGIIGADVTIPAEITFKLPAGAAINAVAYMTNDGSLNNAAFSIERDELTMLSPNGTFHVEFYDSALQRDGNRRLYTMVWQSAHPVGQLTWEVQQPAGSTSMTITPGEATLLQDRFGLNIYQIQAGTVPASEVATLTLSYDKPTSDLTVELLQENGGQAPPIRTPDPDIPVGLAGAAIAVIVLLAGAAGYFFWRFRRATVPAPAAAPHAATAAVAADPTAPLSASASPEAAAVEAGLTEREIEVLGLLADGLMNKEIGRKLGISPRTVSRHRENMMSKLGLHSRTELVKFAIKIGLHDLEEGE